MILINQSYFVLDLNTDIILNTGDFFLLIITETLNIFSKSSFDVYP